MLANVEFVTDSIEIAVPSAAYTQLGLLLGIPFGFATLWAPSPPISQVPEVFPESNSKRN
jgi:hypothetical protein